MKRMMYYRGLIICLLVMVSCNKEEIVLQEENVLELHVTAENYVSANESTRTTDEGYTTSFTEGDEIGVFTVNATTGEVKSRNIPYKYVASTATDGWWMPSGKNKAIAESGTFYLVYYPYKSRMDWVLNVEKDYAVWENEIYSIFVNDYMYNPGQNTPELYSSKDLMIGKGSAFTGQDGKAHLSVNLKHQFSLLLVDMKYKQQGQLVSVQPAIYDLINYGGQSFSPWMSEEGVYRMLVRPSESGNFLISYRYSWHPDIEFKHEIMGKIEAGKYLRYNLTFSVPSD